MLHDLVTNSLKGRYPSVDKMLEGRGWSFMFFLRMIPLLPFDLVSAFAGASDMKFRDFLIGTTLGEIPGAVVLVMLGTSLDNVGSPYFFLALALAVAGLRGLRAGPALGRETPERTVAVTRVRGRMDTEKVHASAIVRFAVAIVFITFP